MALFDTYTFIKIPKILDKNWQFHVIFWKKLQNQALKSPYIIISSYTIIQILQLFPPARLFPTAQLFDTEE